MGYYLKKISNLQNNTMINICWYFPAEELTNAKEIPASRNFLK